MIDQIEFFEVKPGRLRKHYYQKRITLTEQQIKFVNDNHKEMGYLEMAEKLKIGFGKLQSNMKLMGLIKRRESRQEKQYFICKYCF